MKIRPARVEDADDVAAFTRDTWPDRETEDYLPRSFPDWASDDDPDRRTLVADDDGRAVGVVRGVRLTDREAWAEGLRVHPDYREAGLARGLTAAAMRWARERGAVVCRTLIFSWNVASLGLARGLGFDPCTEFRWATVEADADADPDVTADADAGWSFWTASDARDHLRGLALHPGESWTLSELRPADLERAAAADGLLVVRGGGTRGLALRSRTFDVEGDDGTKRLAEYAVGAWADPDAADALFDAVARDAARRDAARARVLVPETVRFVSDAAAARADASGDPEFVLAADLTDPAVGE